MVALMMEDQFDWNVKNRIIFNMTLNILNIRLREIMRESKSKVYGVGIQKSVDKYPKPEYTILVNWGCAPDNVKDLINTVFRQMTHMKDHLPTSENLEKSRETMIRELQTDNEKNSYWLSKLMDNSINKDKLRTKDEITSLIKSVKPEDIRNAAKKYFTEDHYLQVVLLPEK